MEQQELRRRMRAAREWAGLDQAELAAKLHDEGWIKTSGREQISEAENGKRTFPPKVIEAIATICGVPHEFLLDENYDPFTSREQAPAASEPDARNGRGTAASEGSGRRLRTSVRSGSRERPSQADGDPQP